ncbi:hypothetical protein TNCV_536061 [Trichonephila clavipes]|nr:hypothetical protein TNCV_536061 [Trichonephila clavipes]
MAQRCVPGRVSHWKSLPNDSCRDSQLDDGANLINARQRGFMIMGASAFESKKLLVCVHCTIMVHSYGDDMLQPATLTFFRDASRIEHCLHQLICSARCVDASLATILRWYLTNRTHLECN